MDEAQDLGVPELRLLAAIALSDETYSDSLQEWGEPTMVELLSGFSSSRFLGQHSASMCAAGHRR